MLCWGRLHTAGVPWQPDAEVHVARMQQLDAPAARRGALREAVSPACTRNYKLRVAPLSSRRDASVIDTCYISPEDAALLSLHAALVFRRCDMPGLAYRASGLTCRAATDTANPRALQSEHMQSHTRRLRSRRSMPARIWRSSPRSVSSAHRQLAGWLSVTAMTPSWLLRGGVTYAVTPHQWLLREDRCPRPSRSRTSWACSLRRALPPPASLAKGAAITMHDVGSEHDVVRMHGGTDTSPQPHLMTNLCGLL